MGQENIVSSAAADTSPVRLLQHASKLGKFRFKVGALGAQLDGGTDALRRYPLARAFVNDCVDAFVDLASRVHVRAALRSLFIIERFDAFDHRLHDTRGKFQRFVFQFGVAFLAHSAATLSCGAGQSDFVARGK